jgi:hypothetical protein
MPKLINSNSGAEKERKIIKMKICKLLLRSDRGALRIASLLFFIFISVECSLIPSASSAETPDVSSPAGCYAISLGQWDPHMELGADAKFSEPPTRVRLSTTEISAQQGFQGKRFILEPAPGVQRTVHGRAYWTVRDTGEVYLVWSTGFSGLTAMVKANSNGFEGKAETFWDFPRAKQTAGIRLSKVPCE